MSSVNMSGYLPGNLTSNGVRFTVEALIYHFRESKAHLNFSSLLYPYLFDILNYWANYFRSLMAFSEALGSYRS